MFQMFGDEEGRVRFNRLTELRLILTLNNAYNNYIIV